MSKGVRLVGISGSLRRASFNSALLRAAAGFVPDTADLAVETIAGIPLYDFDRESSDGIPPVVAALKDRLAASDGLLLVTPEYNNSIPGVLKNAIDWLSRPPDDIPRVFGNLPVALMGVTPGPWGTTHSQVAWLPVLRTLGTQLWTGGRMLVPRAATVFDADGNLTDDALRRRLAGFLSGFVEFAGRAAQSRAKQ